MTEIRGWDCVNFRSVLLDSHHFLCMHTRMATKTISVDLEAYERMNRARLHPRESFSQVIRRAVWLEGRKSGSRLLKLMKSTEPATEKEIARMDEAQSADSPPDDPWKS